MNSLEILLSKRMIIRRVDPKLYYMVKDDLKSIRKIMQEKFGYIVILTPQLIKLEKIPAIPEIWMGIKEFQSVTEYQMFLYLLMFLEDKEIEEQFVLSHLTDFIQHQFEDNMIDWTNFTTRRQLIRVIQYSLKNHLLILNDGDETNFARDITTEVLYENTGVSRYFMRNFPRNIMEFQHHEDFKQSDWIDIDEDRGIARRHRVYRKLLLACGVYESHQEEDFLYLKNYRNQIQFDFQSYFECDLHVHKSSAYLVLDESCRMGKTFPENNVYADLVLLTNHKLKEDVRNKKYRLNHDEEIS
ncbi:MAG TPA: TIGR02678 family protein, partial [Erysipelothrix sp.]|nr:TIGR02678 family protein [Erysipelothrix sp.]